MHVRVHVTRQSEISNYAPHSDELDQTPDVWRATGAATWRTSSKYTVMLDSCPLAPWYENTTSPTTLKEHNLTQLCRGKTELIRQHVHKLVKIDRVVFEICEQTDKETDRHTHHNISHPTQAEVKTTRTVWQSLACSSPGIAVSPRGEYYWNKPDRAYWSPQCLAVPCPSERS